MPKSSTLSLIHILHCPEFAPVAAAPPEQEMLILEQRRCRIIQPYASLRMDDFIRRSDLEIPSYDQIPDQRHIHFAGACIAQRLPFGSKPEFNQCDVRLIGKVDAVNALLIISWDIQICLLYTSRWQGCRTAPCLQ